VTTNYLSRRAISERSQLKPDSRGISPATGFEADKRFFDALSGDLEDPDLQTCTESHAVIAITLGCESMHLPGASA